MTDALQDGQDSAPGSKLSALSAAMTQLHKEQFGRGPTGARAGWVDDDTIVVTLRDALLPAEQALVELDQSDRVMESRLHFQEATRERFIDTIEGIVGRKVAAFSSATDPRKAMVWEIFSFDRDEAS